MNNTLHSSLLSTPTLLACFTTRHGGTSQPPYTSNNLAYHVGDNAEHVLQNHNNLAAALGYDRTALVHMRQIHSDRIVIIDDTHSFDTPPECDALLTDRLNTPLMVMSADCTPILLYDPITHSIGAVHAGRAGALNKVLPKTLIAMEKEYGTALDDVRIAMGPSIGGCCYEINETIALEVKACGYADALRVEAEKVFLDVTAILLLQLKTMGIKETQIEASCACTACAHETFFSYRADAQRTGRIAGVIMLRPA
jgi:polyphenol oxidase